MLLQKKLQSFIFSLFFSFVAILCGAGLYSSQEPGFPQIWTKLAFCSDGILNQPAPVWTKILFSIRMGLLPVFVLLLHNPHHHRVWGLCCLAARAQLDSQSWLRCHQVCNAVRVWGWGGSCCFSYVFFSSFCFLLWGLSAVASSVNLLVLKFMTISLEEVRQKG